MRDSAARALAVVGIVQEFELRMRQRLYARRVEEKSSKEVTQMTKTELRVLEIAVQGLRIVVKDSLKENRLEKAADANERLILMERQLSVEKMLRQPASGFVGQAF
jgi:hypothetical protein